VEIWSVRVNRALKARLVAAKFFTDYSDEISGEGDILHIPNVTNGFTATAIAVTSGDIAPTDLSDTTTALTLNQWMGTSFIISDYQKEVSSKNYKIQQEYQDKMGYALAKKIDTDLLALGASITPSIGDSATNISATTLEYAMAIMESNNIPLEECAWIFHPYAYYKEVLQSANLVNASKYGRAILPTLPQNEMFGLPVFVTSQVPAGTAGTEGGHRNLLVHKDAIVFAFAAGGPKMQELKGESLRTKYAADVVYGKSILNATYGVRVISNN
jgi:hypothetical protein